MKKKIIVIGLLGILLGMKLEAEVTSCEAVGTVNTSIENLSTAVTNQQELVSKLSDDIGLMADRIGVMADRIGVMADRIVTTEKLLADTLIVLTGNADLGTTTTSSGVVLVKPLDGSTASRSTPPTIELSVDTNTYLLYASTEPTFSDGNTIAIYITSPTSLSTSWQQVVDFVGTNNFVYIAVRSIDVNSKISSLSNSVKLTLQ